MGCSADLTSFFPLEWSALSGLCRIQIWVGHSAASFSNVSNSLSPFLESMSWSIVGSVFSRFKTEYLLNNEVGGHVYRWPTVYCPSGKPNLVASTFKIVVASPSASIYTIVMPLNTIVWAWHWQGLKCSLHGQGWPYLKHFPSARALLMSIETPCPLNILGCFKWIAVDEEGTGVDRGGRAMKGCW